MGERLAQGVERAGANIAKDDADGAQSQGGDASAATTARSAIGRLGWRGGRVAQAW